MNNYALSYVIYLMRMQIINPIVPSDDLHKPEDFICLNCYS